MDERDVTLTISSHDGEYDPSVPTPRYDTLAANPPSGVGVSKLPSAMSGRVATTQIECVVALNFSGGLGCSMSERVRVVVMTE